MIDKLSRAQLRKITRDDQQAIRVLERLLEKVETLTGVGDLDDIIARLEALEAVCPPYGDNDKLYFGDSNDSAIYYDGTDMVIDPKEVGSGQLKTNDSDLNVGESGAIYCNVMYAI